MTKKKHKDAILEILTKSGRVLRSDLKEMVMNKMGLDEYPKQSYAYHIDKLVEEGKIKREESDSKSEYLVIPKIQHKIHGGLLLEAINGRLNIPELLESFDISITDVIPLTLKKDHIFFIFQFNAKTICLKIPKKAIPFKLHLSRKKFHQEIGPLVTKKFGAKTISLELPILQISSFSLDENNSEKNGQLILSIEEDKIYIQDLKATNPSKIAIIKNLSYDAFLNDLSLFTDLTVDSNFEQRSSQIIGKKNISHETEELLELPALILLGTDSQVGIF